MSGCLLAQREASQACPTMSQDMLERLSLVAGLVTPWCSLRREQMQARTSLHPAAVIQTGMGARNLCKEGMWGKQQLQP